jgi:CheY-like chemotaxis protein
MPKKILLIETEQAFAARLSDALEAAGYQARATADGKEGLDLARDWTPEAIVLCVELPSMSGYLVCQKLKKDDALKAIPLVLTSGEATEETFEKHRTLKARADEYLLKPYEPEALIGKLGSLIGLPDPADVPAEVDEELVSLEVEVGLESAEGEPEAEVPGLSLESLPDEPAAERGSAVDDDLRLLDDAFDGLAVAPAPQEAAAALDELSGETRMPGDEVDAAAASLPDDDERAPRADFAALGDEADAALGALVGPDEALFPPDAPAALDETRPVIVPPAPPQAAAAPSTGAGPASPGDPRDSRALERMRGDLSAKDAEVRELRRKLETLSRRAEDAGAELAQANARAEAAQEKARRAEAEAKAGREEARRAAEQVRAAEAEIDELRRKASAAEERAAAAEEDGRRRAAEVAAAAQAVGRAEALEREAEELRTELLVARGEADGARGEIERRTADLARRVAELEATNAKNEERVVKAYQKIKADEKVRDKVRKALAIATQLLEEGVPAESPADKERRAAAAAGRE